MNEAGKNTSPVTALAEIYPQLYLTPGEEGALAYGPIVRRGQDAPSHSLAHFRGSALDSLTWEETPAGPVQIITLGERQDFETFLRIMANRCQMKEIPASQGASILDGVINWTKIRAHQTAYYAEGGDTEGWAAEFKRFTAEPRNFKDALIVLSVGPYSALPACEAGMTEAEWLTASLAIRKAHECTHFICRRLFPDQIDPVWDELAADAVGLYAAFGRYDQALAARFLGVTAQGYAGGRLENYAGGADLNALSRKVWQTLPHLEKCVAEAGGIPPYEMALRLEREYPFWKAQTNGE